MDGIAPIGGSPATSTAAVQGAGATVPGTPTPAPPPPPKAEAAPSFTAFPSSYAGFGTNGTAFGTLGVVNGKLSILSTPSDAAPHDDTAKAPPPVTQAAAAPPPPPKPPPPPPPPKEVTDADAADNAQTPNPYTAIPSQDVPNLQKTGTTDQKVAGESSTLDHATNSADNANNGNTATQADGNKPAAAPASPPPPPPPTGLLGAPSGPPPLPGGTAVENDPALGLLGAPATNPIYIQAQQQQQNAAEATAAAADAAAAAQAAARQQLEQVDFRIAAARSDNNTAAVAQLQPTVAKLTGEIQGQTFAGLGTTPPQPFARPEVPTVFLNIAS